MTSKPDRSDYFKKYDAERKDNLERKDEKNEKRKERRRLTKEEKEQRKQEQDLVKYHQFKAELEFTKTSNSWFNPHRNPYLNRLPYDESKKYNDERKKRFFLQYDMDNLYTRFSGDSKKYLRDREMAYNNFYQEKDLFHRIQYFRIFRREFMKRWNNEEPDKTNQLMNNCIIPSELNPKSSDFRPDLLHLLEEGADSDPPMKVLTPPEWAQKLNEEDSSDDYESDFDIEYYN